MRNVRQKGVCTVCGVRCSDAGHAAKVAAQAAANRRIRRDGKRAIDEREERAIQEEQARRDASNIYHQRPDY